MLNKVIHARGAALLGALALCGALPASAWETRDHFTMPDDIGAVRAMQFGGETPSLQGYSPARTIALAAPADDHYYTAAYKNGKNCVIFFAPLGKAEHDLAFRWEGEQACDGEPVSGKGRLYVQWKTDSKQEGTVTHVSIFEGSFENGMLTDSHLNAQKSNFVFAANGDLKPDIMILQGVFKYGVLHGHGSRTWTGPESAQPSVVREEGYFSEGERYGKMVISRLHPYPGAEGDSSEVVLNDKGQRFTYQGYNNGKVRVVGSVWFYGTSSGCTTRTDRFSGEPHIPMSATLECSWSAGEMNDTHYFTYIFDCDNWEIASDKWACKDGTITLQDDHSTSGRVFAERTATEVEGVKAYHVPIPFRMGKAYQSDD